MQVLSSTPQLTVYKSLPKQFILLQPTYLPPRSGGSYQQIVNPINYNIVYNYIADACKLGHPVALDFETRGIDPTLSNTDIIGMGLASERFSCYLHKPDDPDEFQYLMFSIFNDFPDTQWIAHNVYFDGLWALQHYGQQINWHACTFALYRHLATEGFDKQKWGLKDAMQDLLLWSSANTVELDAWLINNGHKNQSGNPLYGNMWRAPRDILGKYCNLDVEATYLLYTRILKPALNRFPGLIDYFYNSFMPHIIRHIQQKQYGILINRPQLEDTVAVMDCLLTEARYKFLSHPLVAPHVASHEALCMLQYMDKEPAKYLKKKLGKEPSIHKKKKPISQLEYDRLCSIYNVEHSESGEILLYEKGPRKYIGKIDKDRNLHPASVNWEKWRIKRDALLVVSKNWLNWEAKRLEIIEGKHPEFKFNIQSDHNVRWLMYDQKALGYNPIEFTNRGQPSVSSRVLPLYGEIGQLLIEYAGLEKERSYLTDYLNRLRNEERDTLHFGFSMPGTLTGRLSGKNPNIQQLPKNRRCMSLFVARRGRVFIDADWAALEPHVGAELSQDPNLLALYGPRAPSSQDIYLFWGAQVPGTIGDKIRNTGYDPFNPTKEAINKAKKECKAERSLMKLQILSDTYGSGIDKKRQIACNSGFNVSHEDIETIHNSLQEGKAGVLEYTNKLKQEWRENRGYIMSALGRPIGLHQKKLKDLWNSQCQTSGHDLHVIFVNRWLSPRLDQEFGSDGWMPIIWDFHDAFTIEVDEIQEQKAKEIINETVTEFNKWLGGTVLLKMVPTSGKDLATIKEVEE